MSDLQLIKKRIFEEEKIELILEELGCWGISTEQKGELYVAGLPDGDNDRSVQIRNKEGLSSYIRSKGVKGDIFDIVGYIQFELETEKERHENLHKIKYWLCEQLGYLEYIDEFYKVTSDNYKEKPTFNNWLKKACSIEKNIEVTANKTWDLSLLNEYGIVPYLGWVLEGISPTTQRTFGVGIDVRSDRVTFPVHNKNGELIGVKGRYCGRDKKIEDKYKYLYILPCNKSIEFFNLHRALPYIREQKEVLVVEGAKSTMLLDQWGYKNCISIEGDSLSSDQINLLKSLELDTDFIFIWDKDKDLAFIKEEVSRLNGRKRFAVYDKGNLLNAKDSPTDRGKSVFQKLLGSYKYKIS
ncbi:DNA primase [Rossellomorea marisflavi]|uniref:DNA primase n=1 Tax=Rossellomorea marisflavi TaxID=189381 RepID=UPI0025CA2527|nr:DNA primase [Rossellomorea marisflavi]GLI82555.1 DNA primase [Rossellomorea marisflavi]